MKLKIVLLVFASLVIVAIASYFLPRLMWNNANASKDIVISDIIIVENKLRIEFDLSNIKFLSIRGNYCKIEIDSDGVLSSETDQAIKARLEEVLKNGLAYKIIEYCRSNYNSTFVPKVDRFQLSIQTNGKRSYFSYLSF